MQWRHNNMVRMLKLTENLRKELKKPLGEITSFDEISGSEKIKGQNKIIICVGDKTCKLALKNKLKPKICIYDSMISRKKIKIEYDISKPSIKTKVFLDTSKAEKSFGWKPKVSLDEGIEKTIKWYKEHYKNSGGKLYEDRIYLSK